MATPEKDPAEQIGAAIDFVRRQPRWLIAAVLILAAVVLIVVAVYLLRPAGKGQASAPPGTYLFCSWNVENFYDDQDDPANHDELENWFANHPDVFRLKVEHLTDALLLMNDGRGPDVMALYEVENENCLNALKDSLNARLEAAGKADQKYAHVLFRLDKTGRRFAPGIITRLPVQADRTHKFSRHNGRSLEGHVFVNGNDLAVLAAHWTSRVERGGHAKEEHANAARRLSYAQDCYGRFRAILTENPDADVIICGDFNDEFTDESMQTGLRASANADEVRNAVAEPRPLALFANLPPESDAPGTIYGRRHWSTFDHICVSRGLLDDKGWSCDPASARIFAPKELWKNGGPFRFGEKKDDHGYSDHFAVTVRLKLSGSAPP
jgi:endonuclease/exonuclease/phosphatase family metal-dependent hydrolase